MWDLKCELVGKLISRETDHLTSPAFDDHSHTSNLVPRVSLLPAQRALVTSLVSIMFKHVAQRFSKWRLFVEKGEDPSDEVTSCAFWSVQITSIKTRGLMTDIYSCFRNTFQNVTNWLVKILLRQVVFKVQFLSTLRQRNWFENAVFSLRLGLPPTLIGRENGTFCKCFSKQWNLKTPAFHIRQREISSKQLEYSMPAKPVRYCLCGQAITW